MILCKCDDCGELSVKEFSSLGSTQECGCSSATSKYDPDYDNEGVHSSSIWRDPMRGILIDEF